MADPTIAIIDIETTGLDPLKNVILEVGVVLFDAMLEPIDSYHHVCSDDNTWAHIESARRTFDDGTDDFIWKMHTKSGLIDHISTSRTNQVRRDQSWVAHSIAQVLRKNNMGGGHRMLPMTGSSVHFDRKFIEIQMPELASVFSHRCIDVSTIKELSKIYRPDLVQEVSALNPVGAHRSLSDCIDTAGELAVYLKSGLGVHLS